MMEVFDDLWGPIGSPSRSLTENQLREWWVTLVDIPNISVFDATGPNLSKIGTDAQLLSGDYDLARQWALRLMQHPGHPAGILFPSRHDPQKQNLALFKRSGLLPAQHDAGLVAATSGAWTRSKSHGQSIVHGPPIQLKLHPYLKNELINLEVAILP